MTKMIAICAISTLCLISAGCLSTQEPKKTGNLKGNFTLVEFDSRTAEQITAMAPVDLAYASTNCNTCAEGQAREEKSFSWVALYEMIAKLKVRIRILTVQWYNVPVEGKK